MLVNKTTEVNKQESKREEGKNRREKEVKLNKLDKKHSIQRSTNKLVN